MRVIRFSCKCSDMSDTAYFVDEKKVFSTDGYVPSFLPFGGDGDYVAFSVDLDTGQILDWKVPSHESIEDYFEELKDNW